MSEETERARAAALGQTAWGTWGSAVQHRRYSAPVLSRSRRRCSCCHRRATHVGMANGVALMSGCEMSVRRWIRDLHAVSSAERWWTA